MCMVHPNEASFPRERYFGLTCCEMTACPSCREVMLRLWCRRPRRCWLGRMAIVVFTGFLVVTNVFFFTDMAGHVGEIKSETDSTYIQEVFMDTPTLDARKRRERLNAYCDISGGRGEVRPPGDELDFRRGLLVAEKHRLLLCPVGKAASTFLTRFLIALEETNLALSPLQIPPDKAIRVREKYSAYKTLKEFNSVQREKQFLDGLTRVVFVRHPLWRLWSLYVDKLVFPNPYYWRVWGMPAQRRSAVLSAGPGQTGDNFVKRDANRSKHLQNMSPKAPKTSRPTETHRKRSDKKVVTPSSELGLSTDFRLNVSQGDLRDCGQNVRFSEFLDFALEDLHEADWHVRPVSEQCAPCLVNYTVVGHVGSLEADLREVMRELEVPVGESSWQEAVALDAMKEGVSSLFDKWWFEATRCVSAELAARRLWRTFQLRGFLSQTAPFPFTGEGRQVLDARMLEEAAMTAYASSSFARERQKALAFRRAVQDVDDRVLKRLADKYSADFAMFGFTLTNSL